MAKALVITEKPSVARDIAEALGGFSEGDGAWENDDYVLTFAVGHLFELLEPQEIDEKYKRWTLDVLPIIPARFQLKKKKGQSERIRTIQKLAGRKDVDRLVNACDAGREGELIFREVVQYLGIEKPVLRLWLQSMTQDAIRAGFERLRPGEELEGLGQAAECRAYSDWLIGMNATRALTKRLKSRKERTAWSAGRVQTPTLALLVDRELEVLAHVPRPFWRVTATFEKDGHTYRGTWFDPDFAAGDDDTQRDDRFFEESRAQATVEAVRGRTGEARESRKPSRESAPPLFDLTSLQREANRRFGWSARRTLGAAQRCYEGHKLITYPRTDARCLPRDYRDTVMRVLGAYASAGGRAGEVARFARHLLDAGLQNAGRIFDDSGISDHFAIIPTGVLPRADLRGDDLRLHDLVLRRFLGAFYPPAQWERVERVTEVAAHSFRTRARTLVEAGWRAVLGQTEEAEADPLPALVQGRSEVGGVAVRNLDASTEADETRPPPRITEARLLSLMENAGQSIDDESLAAVLHEKGLGTPATRADVIENLIAKGYALRQGKALRPTVKGIRLIDTLKRIHVDRLASAQLTGELEQHLGEVEHGRRSADDFMGEMKEYASEIVDRARSFEYDELYRGDPPLGPCPRCGRPVHEFAWFYRCSPPADVAPEDDCPMRFWKDTSGRYLDRAAVTALLAEGRTPVLDGFTARGGRTYRGRIEVDRDEWKLKVRSEGWNEDGTSDLPEYEVDTQPLGRCPFDEDCEIVETPTHFICPKRLKEEELTAAFRAARRAARERGEPPPERPTKPEHCGFVLPRTVCKREITREEARVYLQNKKTELLTDFTSRFGRPFSAQLVLKDSGRHGFEFPPRGARSGKKDGATASPRGKRTGVRRPRKSGRKKSPRKVAASGARKGATRKKTGTRRGTSSRSSSARRRPKRD